jgi:hypothetical protein
MKLALNMVHHETRGEDMKWRLTYGLLLPLFVISEAVSRLYTHYAADGDEPAPLRGLWIAEARSQASIATSYALMAKSMLRSSERRNRPERLSRH